MIVLPMDRIVLDQRQSCSAFSRVRRITGASGVPQHAFLYGERESGKTMLIDDFKEVSRSIVRRMMDRPIADVLLRITLSDVR